MACHLDIQEDLHMETRINPKMVAAWLDKWPGGKICPVCAENKWIIGDKIVQLLAFSGHDILPAGPVFPVLPITCKVCGYTYLINAVITGAVKSSKKSNTPKSKPEKDDNRA